MWYSNDTPVAIPQVALSAEVEHLQGAHWKASTPDGFKNPWPSAKAEQSFVEAAKFVWSGVGKKRPELADGCTFVPRAEVDFTPPTVGVKSTWLGHAAVLIQYAPVDGQERGLNILFDPVFSDRCGPSQWFGAPRRFTPVPCGATVTEAVANLPPLDIVAISHNHYDHLDIPTIKAIYAKQAGTPPAMLLPLNTTRIVRGIVPDELVREADWWEEISVTSDRGDAQFTYTPAQHMTARTAFDMAASLWGGWCVKTKREVGAQTVWFAGDTGYSAVDAETYEIDDSRPVCPAFKEIGSRLGPIDLAFLPIGAYSTRSFLSTVHCAPIDAVRVFKDVNARKAVAIHWGTWDLSNEPISEPPRMLAEARDKVGLTKDEFDICALGGSVSV
ncbi:uncharacterized protein CcaverHIS019_0700490 [Cutaneotrichosporon cavernicola]|uniref:Metallo-beta-lactamase domain-containing protein n=1 Tax=Cutaneotrichosporon cavernicola TaxID=279322 RepID=A0AA48L9P0_9TREE|nr:uncharacterized protein CcaverHIS019_0700490 [Cutaneotrichosporon cavernicola]BEI94477.1 hypothetical protein CcaverHIS019_0700490 [Cutaneotrichosporon cavernicola]BEJ02253.1 hypothetical protein CcaverHIS631_0700480 [Cutaneotrichosporon cavernicola]BEJ10012.1 hypothetical protein CcaverHIS641_0700470 [Cutaneotrichosporon cavernicola]